MGGWMDGWMGVKAVLRIAYSIKMWMLHQIGPDYKQCFCNYTAELSAKIRHEYNVIYLFEFHFS